MFMGNSYGVLITINLLNVFTLLEEKQVEEFGDWIKEPQNVLINLINKCLPINLVLEKKCIKYIWNLYYSSHELHKTIVKSCFY